MDKQDLNELRSVEELVSYQTSVQAQIKEIDATDGLPLSDKAKEEFADLVEQNKQIESRVKELEERKRVVEGLASDPKKTARALENLDREFNANGRGSAKERDIYELRNYVIDPGQPEKMRESLNDGAKRAIEVARFPQLAELRKYNGIKTSDDDIRTHLENLLNSTQEGEDGARQPGATAMHLLRTGGPVFRRAFWKHMSGGMLDREEQRALSLAGSGGGFAIPFALDPSIIPTSNSVVNPTRAISRLATIAGANTWQGVTSPAVVASRATEGQEATDNATTLVQPQVTVTKAHTFVPFSIEVDEDWPQLEAEFGRLIQDAKDDEEGAAFVTGVGTGVNPQGFTVGTTATSAATTGLVVTAADVYALEAALPPRFRPRESFVANRGIYNKIRGIDTAGGAALWLYMAQGLVTQAPNPGNTGATLLGRGAWEASAMQATVVNATKIMVVGDFSYFLIVDRIGLTVELVPHIFGAANRFPVGMRGLYAYWRNSSKVLSASAFVAMTGTT